MQNIKVKIPATPAGSYDITVAGGLLPSVRARIKELFPGRNLFFVTDKNVVKAGHLKTLLGSGSADVYTIDPPGEISKMIETATAIVEAMEKCALGRDCCVVALGGGTVGDIAGFAAAIFKRGVPVVQVPTTTVSQADSAVGGKTGVDSTLSKNAYGAFWHPAAVFIDVETLQSLDSRQFNAGLVESVKHALIADGEYFDFLLENCDLLLKRKTDVLETLAIKNCSIKAAVVEDDPTEKNRRRTLNYGHTIGHAVESASGFELLHGESVAIGILGAFNIEQQLGLGDEKRISQVRTLFEKLGLPARIPAKIQKTEIIEMLKHDKKAIDGRPLFVLLESCGKVLCENGNWAVPVSPDILEKAIEGLY
ncbi:MAG: 3-dehydroquinate synthase [Anaerohalosphaeraceae bacterium]|nr:3-dehydroquinate synthase [Anaerohalosphaeraceae bacterium]